MFRENINFRQIGYAYLPNEKTEEQSVADAADRDFADGDAIRLVKNAFAYCFGEARVSTAGGSAI